jgi:hypothetical protein
MITKSYPETNNYSALQRSRLKGLWVHAGQVTESPGLGPR